MSQVTFIPKSYGDGFNLGLWEVDYIADSAVYKDQFHDEYEFYGVDEGEWNAEVRED